MNLYRIVDVNVNRVSEGIRVLEDLARFVYEVPTITDDLRKLRHQVRKTMNRIPLTNYRDAAKDIGFEISVNSSLDKKESISNLVEANFKRVQEGIRSIEETLKVLGHYEESKIYEALRFHSYEIERRYPVLKKPILDTDLYGITGEEFSKGRDNIQVVTEMLKADIKVIQYREKDKSKREKYLQCLEIRRLTREAGALFIVNDDLDLALSVKADGIHIGQEDVPIEEIRKYSGNLMVGLSTHNPQQAMEAVEKGADYIGVGPVFPTQTKKDVVKSQGLAYLSWVAENINIPYVAIGGINAANITSVKEKGGRCIAMISEIVGAPSIKEKVKELRNLLEETG
ncbi:thiamine phosphate synthase [Alkaliphilus transvaalensis]|uniref:thiamine phosphate synthase n=1 Tax=Alkaliphilus transvaalensis TaxID=114628 RepID=UPI00047E55B3|nr:thiamine phosphate synthase [Alkaliphilus transvaalensis]